MLDWLRRRSDKPLGRLGLQWFRAYFAASRNFGCAISIEDAHRFLDSQQGFTFGQPGEWLQLAIIDRAADTSYGDCAVRVLTEQPETAEIGVTLARSSQGKGVATEALTAVLEALFEQHGMHRVFAQTDDRNLAVGRLFQRLGFRCEARLVEADWFKGEWSTLRIYAILSREWRDRRRG